MSKKPLVYLDNNAATELSQNVAGALVDCILNNIYGNPSSNHGRGEKLRQIVEAARYHVAESLGCDPSEVIFTSGGTESNNLALRGVYSAPAAPADFVVISAGEHSSVSQTAKNLAGEEMVRVIPLLANGQLDMVAAEELITADTALVSVMLANHETGVIFPVRDIVQLAHKHGALVHCDAVQAYGKLPINVQDLGVDLLSISAHKAHGLAGSGALFARRGLLIYPSITGGPQESGLRAGTENYYGTTSLGTVAYDLTQSAFPGPGLRDAFERGILRRIHDVVINGVDAPRVWNTSSIAFKGIHAAAMLTALEEGGVLASAGPACSSASARPSPTLLAMGVSEEDAASTVRFSFSRQSTLGDATNAIEACVNCAKVLRGEEVG